VDERIALEQALANRPDILAAGLSVGLQQQAVTAAKSRYWPEIDAFFSYRYARPDPHVATLDDWGDAWQAGLILRYTAFDLGREGRIAQERALLRQQEIQLAEAQEAARFDVRSAYLALLNADEAVESQRLNLERAGEGQRLAEVSFREGTIDQVAVLDATTALTDAQLLHFRSIFGHAMARLEVRRAAGLLVPTVAPEDREFDPQAVDLREILRPPPTLMGASGASESRDRSTEPEIERD
jgi:outer membrane protein TolC